MSRIAAPAHEDRSSSLRVSLRDMITALSLALDAVDENSISQHRMVAYISARIGLRMGLSTSAIRNLFLAALVHGVGAVGQHGQDPEGAPGDRALTAAVVGARKLEVLPQLADAAAAIRYNTLDWTQSEQLRRDGLTVPVESAILHLARWITVSLGRPGNILAAVPALNAEIKDRRGRALRPDVVDAYLSLAAAEGFWLDLYSSRLERILARFQLPDVTLNCAEVERLAWLFSLIIDSRSRFTANHSSGVSAAATAIAEATGWGGAETAAMKVAGLLHDIGKLTVSNLILDKRGALDTHEWAAIKGHTFHTHRILEVVDGFDEITCWAADHHEALDGTGYPFHKGADDLPPGSRILAVADVFTALTEDRPYRVGLSRDEVANILSRNVARNVLDPAIVACLLDNYAAVNERRCRDQALQTQNAAGFWSASYAEVKDVRAALGRTP